MKYTDTNNHANLNILDDITPIWGLRCTITPRLGARLVQQGNHLHFLADRAGFVGTFSHDALKTLDAAFPVLNYWKPACGLVNSTNATSIALLCSTPVLPAKPTP